MLEYQSWTLTKGRFAGSLVMVLSHLRQLHLLILQSQLDLQQISIDNCLLLLQQLIDIPIDTDISIRKPVANHDGKQVNHPKHWALRQDSRTIHSPLSPFLGQKHQCIPR